MQITLTRALDLKNGAKSKFLPLRFGSSWPVRWVTIQTPTWTERLRSMPVPPRNQHGENILREVRGKHGK